MNDKKNNINDSNVLLTNELHERIKILQEQHRKKNENIIKKAGSDLISNSPESFVLSVTTLVLSGAGIIAASPVALLIGCFGLIASVSLLGIKFAALMAPVKQSEYEQIQQVTSGWLGITFSAVGQMTGGNKGFENLGSIGSGIDSMIEMRNSLNEIYASRDIIDGAPKLYSYGTSIESFMDSMSILARNQLLTSIHSTNKPMTTTNIKTDPDNLRTQQQLALDNILNNISKIENQEKKYRDARFEKEAKDARDAKEAKEVKARKDAADAKALRDKEEAMNKAAAASAAYFDAYFKMVRETHKFEQPEYKMPDVSYKPSTSSINNNRQKNNDGMYFRVPEITRNEYTLPPENNSSQSSGSNLNYGGSRSEGYSEDSSGESSGLEAPLG